MNTNFERETETLTYLKSRSMKKKRNKNFVSQRIFLKDTIHGVK